MTPTTTGRRRCICIAISVCGSTATVAVGGCVVHGPASEGLLVEAMARCTYRDTEAIVVDLGRVEQMDAAGLGVLAYMYAEARSAGMQFTVENPSRVMREMFHITGLDRFFEAVPAGAAQGAL
jgi:anti-anti-sigma factor